MLVARRAHPTESGGPSNSFLGLIISASFAYFPPLSCFRCPENASILFAGAKAISSLPGVSPTNAQTCGTFRGPSIESPGPKMEALRPGLEDVVSLDHVEPLIFVVVQVPRRPALLRMIVVLEKEKRPAAVLRRHLKIRSADSDAVMHSFPVLAVRHKRSLYHRCIRACASFSRPPAHSGCQMCAPKKLCRFSLAQPTETPPTLPQPTLACSNRSCQ